MLTLKFINAHNVKLNYDKLQLRVPEVKYLGTIVSQEGMKPDPTTISEMPTPNDKASVHNLLLTYQTCLTLPLWLPKGVDQNTCSLSMEFYSRRFSHTHQKHLVNAASLTNF